MLTVLGLASCQSREYKEGRDFSKSFLKHKNLTTDFMAQKFGTYDSIMKSLPDTVAQYDFRQGALSEVNDTLYSHEQVALRFILFSPKQLADNIASRYAQEIVKGETTPKKLLNQIAVMDSVAKKIGLRDYMATFRIDIQQYIDALPRNQQMRIYALSSSPQNLGAALRTIYLRKDADTALILSQVRELRTIYSAAEYKKFSECFNLTK